MSENQRRLHAALDPGCHPKAQRSQHILLRHAESPERPLRPVEIGIGLRMPDIQELFADSGLRFSCESLAALDGLRRQQAARCLPLAAVVRMSGSMFRWLRPNCPSRGQLLSHSRSVEA